jgi:hypothetical protein
MGRISQCGGMTTIEPFLFVIAAVFLLAGFIKGVIGWDCRRSR